MKRDRAAMRRCLERDGACRVCGTTMDLHPHHIVHRGIMVSDADLNLVALCFRCHRAVHAKEFNIGVHLTHEEQAHAVKLIGLGQAYNLLMPSWDRQYGGASTDPALGGPP